MFSVNREQQYIKKGDPMKQSRPKLKTAGVREISRATGYSVCYVSIVRRNMRKARPLRAKMVELGLRFKPIKN